MAGVLEQATVGLHFVALLYIGLGGFLAWHWPKSIFVHVFFAAWGFAVIIFPLSCPLTALQNSIRHARGLGDLPGGFNEYYIYGKLIPNPMLPFVAVIAIALLIVSYVGAYVHWRRRHEGRDSAGPLGGRHLLMPR